MKNKKIGTFLSNTVRLILLVFYAMALTIIIGTIQLCTFAVTGIMRKCRVLAAARTGRKKADEEAQKNKSTSCFPTV